jgi:PAS domain S-box-containing protein
MPRPSWIDYALGAAAAALALVVRLALDPLLENRYPFLPALLAVIWVAWGCGFGPALLAVCLSAVATLYLVVEPRGSLSVRALSDQVGLALFVFGGIGCALLGGSGRASRHRATRAWRDAIRQRDRLQVEVALRRKAEARAAEALHLYRILTEAVPQMVWTANASGSVTYFNRRWIEYTGTNLVEINTPGGQGVIHPDDAERLTLAWREAVVGAAENRGVERFSCEFRLRRADGEFFWYLCEAIPLRDEKGAVVQWVGALTGIHPQKQQAEALERLVAERTAALTQEVEERRRAEQMAKVFAIELQRSNSELEQFAYVASHDLQEPLRKIQAFGDRLVHAQRQQPLSPDSQEYLDRITAAATRMRKLIDDLLSFSRVTSHARPFTPVDLNTVLREVLCDLEIRITQTGAQVREVPLPTIEADPFQMRQLFQNLIGNALKFTRRGEAPVVCIGTEPGPPGRVRLLVADAGIGFDTRYLDRIFQVFQRLHGRNEYEGTGVGLAICKKIVERHNGTITARSQPGQGATFVVELPAQQTLAGADQSTRAGADQSTTEDKQEVPR